MKKGLTELVFILDKSGSMGGLETDTIGGYNTMLKKQQLVDGECHITTVLFDNNYELLHDRIDIKAISPITEKEYQVGGSTALLDAIGRTIHKIGNAQRHTADDYRAEKGHVRHHHRRRGEQQPRVQLGQSQGADRAAEGKIRLGVYLPWREYRRCADSFALRHSARPRSELSR